MNRYPCGHCSSCPECMNGIERLIAAGFRRGARVVFVGWTVIAIAAALLLSSCATVRAKWKWEPPTAGETAVVVATEALIAIDLTQTIQGQRQGFTDGNPILGPHPGTGRVLAFGGLAALAVGALWYGLPRGARYFPTVAVGAIEGATVIGNACVGMGFVRVHCFREGP